MRRDLTLWILGGLCLGCGTHQPPAAPPLFPWQSLWSFNVSASEAPVVALAEAGAGLVVLTQDGSLAAIDRDSGQPLWQVEVPNCSVAAGQEALFVKRSDGLVRCLSLADATVRWEAHTLVSGDLPPALGGGQIAVAGLGLALLDAATGRVRWERPEHGPFATAPLLVDESVVAADQGGRLRCYRLADGEQLWSFGLGRPPAAAPSSDERGHSVISGGDRRLTAFSTRTGRRRWRWLVGTDLSASAIVVQDRVIFAARDAVLYALKRRNGHLLWRAPLTSRPAGNLVLSGKTVLVPCHTEPEPGTDVLGFDLETGKAAGSFRLPDLMATALLKSGEGFVLGLVTGSVQAFKPAPVPSPTTSPTPPPTPSPTAQPTPSPTPTPSEPAAAASSP